MKAFIVDAFTDRPFRGNPAAVCFVESPLNDEAMLRIAHEFNLSETAFVCPVDSAGTFSIRFFSPKMEIALCGHATLASARVVFAEYGHGNIHFINVQNLDLAVQVSEDVISMTFPVYETHAAEAPSALMQALGIKVIKNARCNKETNILLLEIADSNELAKLQPDFDALYRSHDSINGVLVTAASNGDGYDFHSRYFWPWSGTNEDPVTGGTHTFLAKYWSQRLAKTKMKSFQSSSRSGFMELELKEDKVLISSQAVIVFTGSILVQA
jgi:PhzF family phenazine biosynthesis protein